MALVGLTALLGLGRSIAQTADSLGPKSVAAEGLLAAATAPSEPGSDLDLGPLYDRFALTLQPGERTEIFGPFWSTERDWAAPAPGVASAPTPVQLRALTLTLSPLFSYRRQPGVDAKDLDILYPIVTYRRYGHERRLQFMQVLSWVGGQQPDGANVRRFTLFPFVFIQRSSDPALNYTGIIPFYGHVRHHFFRDEASWVFWPIYVQTRKRDVVTDNYLVPFVDVRHGIGLHGWQVWPFVGHEHKVPTIQTNLFGDTVHVPGWDKRFVLWPFVSWNTLGLGSTNVIRQRVVLPFYSLQVSATSEARSYFWPLGLSLVNNHAVGYREVAFPWPFVAFGRGPGRRTARVFPLFAVKDRPGYSSSFYFWPLYRHVWEKSPLLEHDSHTLFFFLYKDRTWRDLQGHRERHRTSLWPLFTAERDYDGRQWLQVLSLLEPFLPSNGHIERSYSPLWSLWRAEQNPKTGARSQSILWNLYRSDTTPTTKKCSFLFGLIQFQKSGGRTRWRLFYIPLSKHTSRSAPAGGAK